SRRSSPQRNRPAGRCAGGPAQSWRIVAPFAPRLGPRSRVSLAAHRSLSGHAHRTSGRGERVSLSLGPVSEVLERELRKKVVRHGVVTWLDADRRYAAFVGALSAARQAGALPYEVRAFSGSFLELMLELAPLSSGTDAGPLVVYLPGFNTESVKETPMLELYKTGTMFQKGLETLVTEAAAGKVAPERIDERI